MIKSDHALRIGIKFVSVLILLSIASYVVYVSEVSFRTLVDFTTQSWNASYVNDSNSGPCYISYDSNSMLFELKDANNFLLKDPFIHLSGFRNHVNEYYKLHHKIVFTLNVIVMIIMLLTLIAHTSKIIFNNHNNNKNYKIVLCLCIILMLLTTSILTYDYGKVMYDNNIILKTEIQSHLWIIFLNLYIMIEMHILIKSLDDDDEENYTLINH